MVRRRASSMGAGLMNDSIFVGLDVHKATISVAVAEAMRGGEVHNLGIIPNRADQIAKLAKKLGKGDRQESSCYEAGPCGYGLHRQLGHNCIVVVSSDPDEGRGCGLKPTGATRRCWPSCTGAAS